MPPGLAIGAAITEDVVCNSWTDCTLGCGGGARTCDRSDGKTWNIDCHVQDCTPGIGEARGLYCLLSLALSLSLSLSLTQIVSAYKRNRNLKDLLVKSKLTRAS
jgi:hypothetical protein